MSGQPPVMPPSLSYKSKAEREKEERERREREEAERRDMEGLKAQRVAARRAAEAERARALQQAPGAPLPPAVTPPGAPPGVPPGAPTAAEPGKDTTPRPSVTDPKSLVMFEEDGLAPTHREIYDIEMLGGPEEGKTEEEEEAVPEEEVEKGPPRIPPRPPKSPDMRPVCAGLILVLTGLAQLIYGVLAMVQSPDAGSGIWSPIVKWGAFSMGFTAAFLGLIAIRGGLWSFRKERFSVVKVGAIAASLCVWAWWIPWLFGLAALVIVHKARDEYYPFYDPRWDAPEWAPPPLKGREEGEEGEEGEGDQEEGGEVPEEEPMVEDHPVDAPARNGDGWEDMA